MTGNQLKDYIDMFALGNYEVVVGCQGYTNKDDTDNETRVELVDGKILIHDACVYTPDAWKGKETYFNGTNLISKVKLHRYNDSYKDKELAKNKGNFDYRTEDAKFFVRRQAELYSDNGKLKERTLYYDVYYFNLFRIDLGKPHTLKEAKELIVKEYAKVLKKKKN